MQPDERLDVLLATRAGADRSEHPADAADALEPLLEAVDRLDTLRMAEPDPTFSHALEARLLSRAESLAANGSGAHGSAADGSAPIPLARAAQWMSTVAGRRREDDHRTYTGRWRGGRARLLWPAAAAALALVIGGGTLTAAAHALPGSPLFGVRRLEQNVQVNFASSAGDRVRLHLTFASDALAALDAVVTRHGGDPAYADALSTLRDEDEAAASGVAGLPAGSERDALADQLDVLRARERGDLRAALRTLGWPDRIATTAALGQAGDSVPRVLSVAIRRSNGSGSGSGNGSSDESAGHRWQVIVQGTGFQPGATLLVNGAAAGTITAVSPTELQAEFSDAGAGGFSGTIGIGNPDGTAAVMPNVGQQNREESTPGPQATATPGRDHGTGGDGGHGGSHGGTPTPTLTHTPGEGG